MDSATLKNFSTNITFLSPQQRKKDGYRTYKLMKNGWCVERFGERFDKGDVVTVLNKHNITIPTTG